jgi:hypothetical protein
MASTVISGASNPSYRNNTGENVRVVINYMAGTPFTPEGPPARDQFGSIRGPGSPAVPSRITISWAGLSVGSSSNTGNISIGRNLAYSQLFRDTAAGGTQAVQIGELRPGDPGFSRDAGFRNAGNAIFTAVGVNNSVALAAVANNATGFVGSLPTELMLAPGETFNAVCGVYNIVVIPENG